MSPEIIKLFNFIFLRYKYEKSILVELHHSQPWFKSNLDRSKANELLTKAGINNGKFLVRSSGNLSTPNSSSSSSSNANSYNDFYKISLCYNKEIKHYKIKYVESVTSFNQISGKFKLDFGLEFDSIIQLVDYYHRCADGLADILRIPLLPIPNRLDPLWLNSLAFKANGQLTNQPYSQHSNNVKIYIPLPNTAKPRFCLVIKFASFLVTIIASASAPFGSQAKKHSV